MTLTLVGRLADPWYRILATVEVVSCSAAAVFACPCGGTTS